MAEYLETNNLDSIVNWILCQVSNFHNQSLSIKIKIIPNFSESFGGNIGEIVPRHARQSLVWPSVHCGADTVDRQQLRRRGAPWAGGTRGAGGTD